MPFDQQMTFPVELTLRSTANGQSLFAWPVAEIEGLYTKSYTFSDKPLAEPVNYLQDVESELFDISGKIEFGNAKSLAFSINGCKFVYNCTTNILEFLGKKINVNQDNNELDIRVLIDRTSIEFFAEEGNIYIPYGDFYDSDINEFNLSAVGEGAVIKTLTINELSSIWK